jgi:hypothetical protein
MEKEMVMETKVCVYIKPRTLVCDARSHTHCFSKYLGKFIGANSNTSVFSVLGCTPTFLMT